MTVNSPDLFGSRFPAFQPLVDRFRREELTGKEFLLLAEKLKSELITRVG